jgi:putative ABC transport system substrate-binding protein
MDALFRWTCFAKRNLLFLTALLSLPAAAYPVPSEAYHVSIVTESAVKPYRDAIRGFTGACACTTKEARIQAEDNAKIINGPKPDAVLAVGTNAFRKARSLQGLPVLYLMVMPSETHGLPDNVSGVSMDIAPGAYLSSFAELFPRAKKVGLLYDPLHSGPYVAEASEIAQRSGIELTARAVGSPRDVPALLDEMRGRIDVFWMLPDPAIVAPETVDYILLFSFENNVPVFSFSRKYVEMGAVAALHAQPFDMGVQAGQVAKALTKGAKGPLRQYPNTVRLIINRKVAAKMGIRFTPDILRKAE